MLSCASLCDDALLAHTQTQQGLAHAVVDLVCTSVVQVFPLQVDLWPRTVLPIASSKTCVTRQTDARNQDEARERSLPAAEYSSPFLNSLHTQYLYVLHLHMLYSAAGTYASSFQELSELASEDT